MAELRSTRARRTDGGGETRKKSEYRSGAQGKDNVTKKTRRPKKSAHKFRKGAWVILIIFLAVCGIAGGLLYKKYGPGRTWVNYQELYGCGSDSTVIIADGTVIQETVSVRDGRTYIPADAAGAADGKWYIGDEGLLLYSLADETVMIAPDQSTYTIGGTAQDCGYTIWYSENGINYISADFMTEFSGMRVSEYAADTEKGVPERIYLDSGWSADQTAKIKLTTSARQRAGVKSPIVAKAKTGSTVRILDTIDDWTKIRTEDGYVGYVKSADLTAQEMLENTAAAGLSEFTSVSLGTTVSLAFHQVFDAEDNASLAEALSTASGINCLSPTWFAVTDNSGNISSLADASYVEQAHSLGMQVWGLIDDFDANVDDLTYLASTAARANTIAQLMDAVNTYGLDGINVDFESIDSECAPHYLQFLRELSIVMRAAGKVLSVDNYPPSGGRDWYDMEEQGQLADYVVVMAYDQHYKGSEPGTNASLSFTENAIAETVADVAADKVVVALPFFTRLWWQSADEDSSKAVGMPEAEQTVESAGAEKEWQEDLQQYYATWEQDGTTYQIWMEDAASLGFKLDLVGEYGIAGAAYWKLGLETSDIWPLVTEKLGN